MQPVISMRQALGEHLLLACGVCNSRRCVVICQSRRKGFVAVVFIIIGALCRIARLLLAQDPALASLFLPRWSCSHSSEVPMRVLCSSAKNSMLCSIFIVSDHCRIAMIIVLRSVLCSITVCVGIAVRRLWHKECVHGCRLCALRALAGEQQSFCGGAVVEQALALVHHCDAFAREDRCFCFDATVACGQEYAELARREPHCAIRTEYESLYSSSRTLHESALRGFRCTLCSSNAAHTCDERLHDPSKRLLCLGQVLRHVEVCGVGCSHRCCKCAHD